jgi:hypothetical protein
MNDASESRDLVPAESASLPAVETRRPAGTVVPAIVAAAGDGAARRFLEFFAVTIDNPNTRAAYFHACRRFFVWCDRRKDIEELVDEPMHARRIDLLPFKRVRQPDFATTNSQSFQSQAKMLPKRTFAQHADITPKFS